MSRLLDPDAHRHRIEEIYAAHIQRANDAVKEFVVSMRSPAGVNWQANSQRLEAVAMTWGHDLYDDLMETEAAVGYQPEALDRLSRSHAARILQVALREFRVRLNPENDRLAEKIAEYLRNALSSVPPGLRQHNERIYLAGRAATCEPGSSRLSPTEADPIWEDDGGSKMFMLGSEHRESPNSSPADAPHALTPVFDRRHELYLEVFNALLKRIQSELKTSKMGPAIDEFLKENKEVTEADVKRYRSARLHEMRSEKRKTFEGAIVLSARKRGIDVTEQVTEP